MTKIGGAGVSSVTVADLLLIAGVAPQMDDTDKLAVSVYGRNLADGDQQLRLSSDGHIWVQHRSANGDNIAEILGAAADGSNATFDVLLVNAENSLFNGTTWDRQRANFVAQILASAARTATLNSSDQTNYNAKGVIITLDVTAIAATPSITLRIQHRDNESGQYENLLIGAAVTATGVHTYIVYPGVAAAAEDIVETIGFPLGRIWRVRVEHGDTDSITYSVGAALIL